MPCCTAKSKMSPTFVLAAASFIGIALMTGITAFSSKASIEAAGEALTVGAPVQASDDTIVGRVSGISRDPHGHIHRIRIATAAPLGLGERTITVRDSLFTVVGGVVKMRLTVAEVNALPTVMTEDAAAADTMGPF